MDKQTGPTSFDSHVNVMVEIRSLEREQTRVLQQVAWLEQTAACLSLTSSPTDGPLQIVRDEVVKMGEKLKEIVSPLSLNEAKL